MAGLVPATPIMWHGRAPFIGVAGTSPAMTVDGFDRDVLDQGVLIDFRAGQRHDARRHAAMNSFHFLIR
jgi:hypothetical protein